MNHPDLHACFLGPYGENDTLLEKLLVEFLREHVYWRRNFHPEDPPVIPTDAAATAEYRTFESRLRRELHALSAALKHSVPAHSPRYIGHMMSDLLLPALAAQYVALPYNPNNISSDTAPITVDLELKVGLQFARLFGYPDNPARPDCAFGHLTSGGTTANLQALRLALALKAFPVALRVVMPELSADLADDWYAFNLPPSRSITLLEAWLTYLADLPAERRRRCIAAVERERIEALGQVEFFARHPELRAPLVIAPASAHYSWRKNMQLLGLGAGQLMPVAQCDARIDADALDMLLDAARAREQPVLMCVGMLGTTEYGAIDPIDRLVDARDHFGTTGFGFAVHVDAAWGGYLATVFRKPDGSLRKLAAIRRELGWFPTSASYAAVAALARTDSITVDPHKLGYAPYGTGAFVGRDQRAAALLAIEASYVFTDVPAPDYFSRLRQLGRYVIEGSKPGAAAASVYVTHRVLPLDHEHFGRIPARTLHATAAFVERMQHFADACADSVHACVPFTPDSNLVCLALNPRGNRTIEGANAFVSQLLQAMSLQPDRPIQACEFFGSSTTIRLNRLDRKTADRLLARLGLPAALTSSSEPLKILRHTLMNPFLLNQENGIDYIGRYFDYLAHLVAKSTSAFHQIRINHATPDACTIAPAD